MKPTAEAYHLMQDGALALARVEAAGMRVDVARLDANDAKVSEQIDVLTGKLQDNDVWRVWKRIYGGKASLGSRQQLSRVLYKELGHEVGGATRTGRISTDERLLRQVNLPFVKSYLEMEKLKKLRSTYLMGVRREVVDGAIHPTFNLHFARTYRSSSDSPNFQNIPVRDETVARLIRSCFVPRPGHVLVELDYSQLEVRVAACYNRDPVLIEYICDPTRDMHRDMAAELYMVEPGRVSKEMRFTAKNSFVFPQFYGSYYAQCAPFLWEAAAGMETADGVPVREHLAGEGVTELGRCDGRQPAVHTFESHVQEVEADFWGRRFQVYDRWKRDWWAAYQKRGWCRMLTGFVVTGPHKRNDAINYPVQGAAFHCLLWPLIRLVRWLAKRKMRSLIVGQIHDSVVADVHEAELDGFLAEARRTMTEDVRRAWPWIVVPLAVEAKVGRRSWHEMEELAS